MQRSVIDSMQCTGSNDQIRAMKRLWIFLGEKFILPCFFYFRWCNSPVQWWKEQPCLRYEKKSSKYQEPYSYKRILIIWMLPSVKRSDVRQKDSWRCNERCEILPPTFLRLKVWNCFREHQKRFRYHRKSSSSWRLSFVIMVQITWWSWGTIHYCTSIRSRTRLIQRIVQSTPMPLLNLSDLFGQRAPCQLLSFISVFLNYNLSFKLSVITRVCFDLVAFGELDREKKSCYLPGAMGSCV